MSSKNSTPRLAASIADVPAVGSANTALVNGKGKDHETILGIALHELSHLFMYGVTRSMMPSWYSEGFAETYGGAGVYEWKGATLTCRRNTSLGRSFRGPPMLGTRHWARKDLSMRLSR